MAKMANKQLTQKQERFCLEYIIDFNGAAAAVRAGYSEKGSAVAACRLLTNVNIQTRIRSFKNERSKRTEVTADRVVQELARVGFANIKDLMRWGNKQVTETDDEGNEKVIGSIPFVEFNDSDFLDEEQSSTVSEVKIIHSTTGSTLSLKTHDKLRALEKLAIHTGVLELTPEEPEAPDGQKVEFHVAQPVDEMTITRGK